MKKLVASLIIILPFAMGAKTDPLATIPEPKHTLLSNGIERYARDEIAQNWADLYEIADQDGTKPRDDRFTESKTALPREQFSEEIRRSVADGETPIITSFKLIQVIPAKDGYDIHACSAGKRESFYYKGIIEFHAIIIDGTARFGPWYYVVNSPHSCSQKVDSN